jgi:hypothetical protein
MDNCQFRVPEMEFLDSKITPAGAAPQLKQVETVHWFRRPEDTKQLQRFLALVNFHRRFIPVQLAV